MRVNSRRSGALAVLAMLALPAASSLSAQQQVPSESEAGTTVFGPLPPADLSGLEEGPALDGFISARSGDRMQVTSAEGIRTVVGLSEGTEIRSRKGFLGMGTSKLGADSLLNGLPVTVRTRQWEGGLVASYIRFRGNDLKTASMIRNGTEQGFAEQTAATEALRGRMGDIDKYNIKSTTNVHFRTGKSALSPQAKAELCDTASMAKQTDNALLLVVGYTDSTGSQDFNQLLSEKRASRVVNYLQQSCSWKPYRMLTPTGMSEADPLADNYSAQGRAQNRRVSVNVLVSKSVDGL